MQGLIAKLEAWTQETSSFHGDRQLADEVLIADGWRVTKDDTFEGGFRWSWGTNPEYHSSESTRPHPINDMNAAMGMVPFKAGFVLEVHRDLSVATIIPADGVEIENIHERRGDSSRPAVALTIAALKYMAATRK